MCVEVACRVIELPERGGETALVDMNGAVRRISLAVLMLEGSPVRAGDWLLSHTGLALRVLSDDEARQMLADHRAMVAASEGIGE